MSANEDNNTASSPKCSFSSDESLQIRANKSKDTTNCNPLSASTIMDKWKLENEANKSEPSQSSRPAKTVKIRWFNCDICEYRSAYLADLKIHIRTHTGEKPYKCTECDYSSAHPSSLKKHSRKHTGEKPYVCKECSLSFRQPTSLKRHIRTHTGERNYKCDICHHAFADCKTLKHHYRIHTGEKPYKCHECGYSSTHSGALKAHIRRHTGERPYQCSQCQKGFRRLTDMKTHQKKAHIKDNRDTPDNKELPIHLDSKSNMCIIEIEAIKIEPEDS